MSDTTKQLLLRRYISTQDPFDAVKYVNADIRSGAVQKVWVWVVQYLYDPYNPDQIYIYTSEEDAYNEAAQTLSSIIEDEQLAHGEDELPSWMNDVLEEINQGDYKAAVATYDTNQQTGRSLFVYQEPVR